MDSIKKRINTIKNRRFKRFFQHLIWCTNVGKRGIKEILYGANVEVNDGGSFYNLMCHDILTCERKRHNKNDKDCSICNTIFNAYYEKASYMNGSSHMSWRDEDYPQYRLGKKGKKAEIPNLVSKKEEFSDTFDFIIGLRRKNGKIYSWFQFEAAMGKDELNSYKDLEKLDNETKLTKFYKMSTLGHVKSTIDYKISGENQGPFGTTSRNDTDPLTFRLKPCSTTNIFFRPIKEEDSVNYAFSTDCFNERLSKLKF